MPLREGPTRNGRPGPPLEVLLRQVPHGLQQKGKALSLICRLLGHRDNAYFCARCWTYTPVRNKDLDVPSGTTSGLTLATDTGRLDRRAIESPTMLYAKTGKWRCKCGCGGLTRYTWLRGHNLNRGK